MRKNLSRIIILVLAAGLTGVCIWLNRLMPILTGYPAKYLCSAVFVDERDPAAVEALDLNFSFVRFVRNRIDYNGKSVTSSFLWGQSTAIYREGFGCTLVRDVSEEDLRKNHFPAVTPQQKNPDSLTWPVGNFLPDSLAPFIPSFAAIADSLMTGGVYGGHPFAFLVVQRDRIVAERYAPGFSRDKRILSWSMAKSFTCALAGMMVRDGLLNLDEKVDLPEWRNDARRDINVRQLMQMESGLEWNEDYGNRSDVTQMLYEHGDFAAFAAGRKAVHQPGTYWCYSSGNVNIFCRFMRNRFPSDSAWYSYVNRNLFFEPGMPGAVFEPDAAGTLAGSSYIHATARDYARLGLLFLHNGRIGHRQLLPEGWVQFASTPAPHSGGQYGALFWLNRAGKYPDAPRDLYYSNGYNGQRIFIIPSLQMVIVILGYSPYGPGELDFNRLLKVLARQVKS